MTVTAKVLVAGKTVENSQTTQYTATNVTTIVDKCTVWNYTSTPATIAINIVTSGGSAGNSNLVLKTKTIQASETYTCPEIVGQILASGDFISTIAGTASAIGLRISGREIT